MDCLFSYPAHSIVSSCRYPVRLQWPACCRSPPSGVWCVVHTFANGRRAAGGAAANRDRAVRNRSGQGRRHRLSAVPGGPKGLAHAHREAPDPYHHFCLDSRAVLTPPICPRRGAVRAAPMRKLACSETTCELRLEEPNRTSTDTMLALKIAQWELIQKFLCTMCVNMHFRYIKKPWRAGLFIGCILRLF